MTGSAGGGTRLQPIGGAPFGAFVEGAPLANLDPTTPASPELAAALADGLARHRVLVFRGQSITPGQLVALGRAFGELEILPEPDKRHAEHPEIFNLSNVRSDGEIVTFDEPQAVFLRGTERWHTDSSFRAVPCLCTMLYAVEVPEGSATQFADMVAGWSQLAPARQAEVEGLRAVHSYEFSRANNPGEMEPMSPEEQAKYPPVVHPLVRTNADGSRSVFAGGHASHLDGWPEEEGRTLIRRLEAEVTVDEVVYTHYWQPDDLVVWDNRTTLHRLRPYDIANQRRVMRRITVAGTEPPRP